ncbi:MAG: phosphoenolpyruvate kinase [Myxococcales bacterium]|nr:phosphoenolpyruvate kinase [Myxococcales bacterium]|tara:strand:- start:2003 stop:3451 length:1449 start_codon:yes stop_codon:yes gene_type:complete
MTTLTQEDLSEVLDELCIANTAFAHRYPGESHDRQPVHTIYGGAQLFKKDTAEKIGKLARGSLTQYAPNFVAFAQALQFPGYEDLPTYQGNVDELIEHVTQNNAQMQKEAPHIWLAHAVYDRMVKKLEREPVEDFRIDFEDGYGNRPDDEEDGDAKRTAGEVALGMTEGTLPPFIGIRIKPLSEQLKRRSLRTLDLFVSTLVEKTGGKLPDNFVVTLPKVVMKEEVSSLVKVFGMLESKLNLAPGTLKMEIMIETTQSILGPNGSSRLPVLVDAGAGRITGCHFGTYDYTASCQITADHQVMDHPSCDFALEMMKVAYGNTGIFLSNGATNVMPVGPHAKPKDGTSLSDAQLQENADVVHRAWRLSYSHIRHSLIMGYYQGWDLHPAQVPIRYAAMYYFFLEGARMASLRLKSFMDKAAQATLVGDVFDDAATGQGLLNYFLRGMNSGAISEEEATDTGLTLEEIRSRSFAKILDDRRQNNG